MDEVPLLPRNQCSKEFEWHDGAERSVSIRKIFCQSILEMAERQPRVALACIMMIHSRCFLSSLGDFRQE